MATSKQTAPVRVAYIVHSLGVGGLERCVAKLANGLPRDRFQPTIISLTVSGPATQWLDHDDIEVRALGGRGGNSIRTVTRLARALKQLNIQAVHSHNWGTLLETALARRVARTPLHIHTEHGQDSQENLPPWKRNLRGTLARWAFQAADAVIICAESNRNRVSRRTGFSPEKLLFVPNGVDAPSGSAEEAVRLRHGLGIEAGATVIGSAGRLVAVKDFVTAVGAVLQLVARNRNVHLVLVGDGPERARIEAAARSSDIADRVHLVGQKEQVGSWLRMFDIYINSSISEAMSMGILEAMSLGRPVVATDVGDNSLLVAGASPSGMIAPRGDAKAIADAVEQLLSSQRRALFSEAGITRHQGRYTEHQFVKSHAALYERLMIGAPEQKVIRRPESLQTA